MQFDPQQAFSRNRGLISEVEQQRLSQCRIVVAGCGGVGGSHALALARLGVGRFRVTDPDTYSVANFNRQVGANIHTVDRNKAEVVAEMISAINPCAEVEVVPGGINAANAAQFVVGADLVVDGVDFFALRARRTLFASAWEAGIPAMTAAPLGFSATVQIFAPGGMSFDEYFDLHEDQSYFDQIVNFLLGLAPAALHLPYTDLSGVDPKTGRGPSSVVGVQLAACLVAAQAVKVLLDRGNVELAPHYVQFDAYRLQMRSGRLAKGNRAWTQRVKRRFLVRKLQQLGLAEAFELASNY